jgi:hypothetical protein
MDESSKSRREETREFWEAAIRLWQDSGLSVREFCSREGLAEHTFYARRRELLPESTASEARRFASQLTAINAGIKPVFRSEGGRVTNIGDITVNVSGGGSSHQTARSIAVALKRELRRGTSTL